MADTLMRAFNGCKGLTQNVADGFPLSLWF